MIFGKLKKIVFQKGTDVVQSFNQFQDGLLTVLNLVLAIPYLGGNIITGVKLEGNGVDNQINTGLSYDYRGWFILRKTDVQSLDNVFESDTVNNHPDKVIILKSLGPMTITLLVY